MDARFLEEYGFDSKEAKVYLSLLKLSKATATQVSYDTHIDRTLCYSIFERLMEKGFVSVSFIEGKKVFSPQDPKLIFKRMKESLDSFETRLPELENIYVNESAPSKVETLYGKNGLKTILDDIIKEGKEYLIYGSMQKWQDNLPIYLRKFLKKLDRKKIKEKVLLSEGEKVLLTKKHSEIRYLPKDMIFPTSTLIYANKMALVIWIDPINVILISNKDIVNSHTKHFEYLWKKAKKK
jgi:sugar-specific transcriptional regulator TrmB